MTGIGERQSGAHANDRNAFDPGEVGLVIASTQRDSISDQWCVMGERLIKQQLRDGPITKTGEVSKREHRPAR